LLRMAKSQEIFWLPSLCHITIRVEAYKARNGLMQCHNCQQFCLVWSNCKQPPRCCGPGVVTCTRSALRKGMHLPPQHVPAVGWQEKNTSAPVIGAAYTRRMRCRKRSHRRHPGLQHEGCSLPTSQLQACPSW
jgi:hypothetical protein